MCGPVAFMAASSIVSLIAGVGEARAQRDAGRANQQIAENNATLAEQGARDALNLGAREQQKSAWRTRALLGKEKASIAANGIDMDFGSASDILGETALLGGAERSEIELDAARKAWGLQGEATNFRNEGAQAAWGGKVGSQSTILKSLGSSLSMMGSAYSMKKNKAA